MGFWNKLLKIDRRWIYTIIWLVVMIPLLFPFKIKPMAMPPVTRLFNYIDTMPEDKALVISVDYTPDIQPELHPMCIALLHHAFATKRKVGLLTLQVMGLGLGEAAIRQVTEEFNAHATTHEDSIINGEDYVYWGWTTPIITILLGMGERITNVYPVDYYGHRTESLPIMKHLKNYDDIGIVVSIAGSSIPISWVNFANTQFGVPIGCGATAVSAADYYPYLNSGQFTGMMAGMKGAAEYEQLVADKFDELGIKWELRRKGTEAMSSQTAAHIAIMIFIIIGNIAYFVTRRRKK
ncbi:hypothetical protein CH330_00430 [candidate division WOR-3 bacterium JGI_Cruoil_03_51_56]|uniref:Uncharacterized protein n=1 Tax=candidate division WOR-3 bacterium JGI_Cruoil_03_51_56 TaxID=1973747 RepID=A0A235BYS5_UNCW3|nr:MAG: hypothetical protein CH330_00430 [candidate division WOR-3 bacterium JGI_Cruoil_03_51_56]